MSYSNELVNRPRLSSECNTFLIQIVLYYRPKIQKPDKFHVALQISSTMDNRLYYTFHATPDRVPGTGQLLHPNIIRSRQVPDRLSSAPSKFIPIPIVILDHEFEIVSALLEATPISACADWEWYGAWVWKSLLNMEKAGFLPENMSLVCIRRVFEVMAMASTVMYETPRGLRPRLSETAIQSLIGFLGPSLKPWHRAPSSDTSIGNNATIRSVTTSGTHPPCNILNGSHSKAKTASILVRCYSEVTVKNYYCTRWFCDNLEDEKQSRPLTAGGADDWNDQGMESVGRTIT